ncbi:hypothetical protein AYI68_g4904 [Smittium mucronatum]|uniref:Uncharacterized protein n=1 Tax=Smittium mucronatum TaxID=133383 RepID=A0A1R0GVR8_9FUNG|nr:hypothetical protein AYI68_g4904 [Smittium mucronatum]
MDLDTYIDKKYVDSVIKFIIENNDKRIYFGFPRMAGKYLYNDGYFYGISGLLLQDYCSCKINPPTFSAEDVWFANTLHSCIKEKNKKVPGSVNLNYMRLDSTKIHHKNYDDKGIRLRLGRNAHEN